MATTKKPKAPSLSFPCPKDLYDQIENERKNDRSGEPVKKAVFCRMLLRIGLAQIKRGRK